MSTASPLDEFETRYLGEPAPRRPGVAFVLSLLAPGLGHVYHGRLGAGLSLQAIGLSFVVGYLVALSTTGFVPHLPGLVAFIGAVWLVLMVGVDAAVEARQRGDDYVRRDVNHPLVYAAVAIFAWWGPLLALDAFASHRLYRVVIVPDDGMEPGLLAGDRVRVDLDAYRSERPRRSDVVVFEDPLHEGRLDFGRVVGAPGEEVVLVEGMPYVDDAPLAQGRPSEQALAELIAVAGDRFVDEQILLEDSGEFRYPIAVPVVAWWGEPVHWSTPTSSVSLLNDRRGRVDDSREFGPVSLDAIIGRVDHVAWSAPTSSWLDHVPPGIRGALLGARVSSGGEDPRSRRTGRRVHPGPSWSGR
jgi:signal peptidase I